MKALLNREGLVFNPPELGCVLSLSEPPGGGSKIYDRSPYGNHGTITGATWTRLPSGLWCLSFDGNDDWVNCGANESIKSLTYPFTVELWYNPSRIASETGVLVSLVDFGYSIKFNTSADHHLCVGVNGNQVGIDNSNFSNGVWSHIAARYISATDITAFLNGVDKSINPGNWWGGSATNVEIGSRSGGSNLVGGYIALVHIYRNALSNLQIQNHFAREKHLFGVW